MATMKQNPADEVIADKAELPELETGTPAAAPEAAPAPEPAPAPEQAAPEEAAPADKHVRTLDELLAQGKKDGKLPSRLVIDTLDAVNADPDQTEQFYNALESAGVEIDVEDILEVLQGVNLDENAEPADAEIKDAPRAMSRLEHHAVPLRVPVSCPEQIRRVPVHTRVYARDHLGTPA